MKVTVLVKVGEPVTVDVVGLTVAVITTTVNVLVNSVVGGIEDGVGDSISTTGIAVAGSV